MAPVLHAVVGMGDNHTTNTSPSTSTEVGSKELTSSNPAASNPAAPPAADATSAAVAALMTMGLDPKAAAEAVANAQQAVKASLQSYVKELQGTLTIEEIACDDRISAMSLDDLVAARTGKTAAKNRKRMADDDPARGATAGEVLQAAPQDGRTWDAQELSAKIGRQVSGGVLAALIKAGKIVKAGSKEVGTGYIGLYRLASNDD